jgi:hypothetical protein
MAIQIGKYRRPGIFIEEFDQSVISSPIVTGITNTVIGVSKKGPVNTPILLTNIGDLERIYGSLDRQLERKGSYFHRTISKMLETSPVFAINLLLTDDNLDRIEYQSLSCATTINNADKRIAPYRRFFDTTGFWKRDTESFLNVDKPTSESNKRLLNFTNLSDRPVSIFVFKSKRTGFDRPLLEWYGGVNNLPPYLNEKDLASDYLVDILVVAGDFSNYRDLSVDPRYSNYFSPTGLRKNQVRSFADDRNVTTLAYVEGLSLIPYFRDLEGRNIFIETAINRGTDFHGVFCSFNVDLFENDYSKGLVDLIGNNLVFDGLSTQPPTSDDTFFGSLDQNDNKPDGAIDINFLSYQERITENLLFRQRVLDRPGNVIALFGTASLPTGQHSYKSSDMDAEGGILEGYITNSNRTYWFAEGYVNDVTRTSATFSGATVSVSYSVDAISQNGYVVINGQYIKIENDATFDISSELYPNTTATQSYTVAFAVDTTGEIKMVRGTLPNVNPLLPTNDVVLGFVNISLLNGVFTELVFTDVYVNENGYNALEYGVDFEYSYSNDKLRVDFLSTNSSINTSDYIRWRRLKTFRTLVTFLSGSSKDRGLILYEGDKYSTTVVSISNIVDRNTSVRSFELSIDLPSDSTENLVVESGYVDNYFVGDEDILLNIFSNQEALVFYQLDDELVLGVNGLRSKSEPADLNDLGVVGRFSTMYNSYTQGIINSQDVIYQKVNYTPIDVQFLKGEELDINLNPNYENLAGFDYVVFKIDENFEDYLGNIQTELIDRNIDFFESVSTGYKFLIDGILNSGVFTVKNDEGLSSVNGFTLPTDASDRATLLGFTQSGYYAFEVEENINSEVFKVFNLFSYNENFDDKPIYLDMRLDEKLNLEVDFEDYELVTLVPFASIGQIGEPLWSNYSFYVNSFDSNYKQSVEVEEPANYTQTPNSILVRAERYVAVRVGDYLEASYNPEELQPDEMPRKLTRILSKRVWSGDSNLVELTCDSEIKLNTFGNERKQTFRHTTIDNYVTTYKAISLKGFKIRQASLPDGTEERQNAILNLVGKGTPLFKSITNKEAFDFRYLIDSFGLGLTERSKQQLVDICGSRLDCFGILNMPSLKSFKNSSSPTFVDNEGVLQTAFIAQGGDPESNPSFLYSFGDGVGVSTVGYFTPYLTVNDNGRPIDVPPAAYVATTFMRKHNSNVTSIVPWTIAAGVSNGRITNIAGLEADFSPEDIENLNLAQMNPIVLKKNRGYVIETENTAQTLFKSSLSLIHVREVLIELERELSAMLLDFQWKFNTPEIRAEIKLRADVICESFVAKNGLFNYFNKCDEENNTEEIIDNQIGVLDTFVEPVKGMGVIVNNITILRTGAINSGGFILS